ncbi:3-hydroxybutyrate dehydrogenase [Rubrimonas cliftonensis]|uniref:3-hydroxybutyrate dehydrogenase n=1 Tax=Rubrimonas cliftonensis TaxID=89524 RepID=A0A1H4G0A0_9RHOB|nr:3-hydroxybutyrate dehydrogenase [Rubrimonas cliftonensis]SEB03019.1 3-hydroxybutyrate dehydrogenase [Rubrimonas cliftonensis]
MGDDKAAIITGSTSGIGLGVAKALAGSGMNVMLNGFGDADEIESIRSGLASETGVDVRYSGADMSRPEAIEAMVDEARAAFGRIDVIVPNAGIQVVSPVEDFPLDRFELLMRINLFSVFHLTRLVFAGMKERKWGRVINIASAHGLVASPYKSAYVAAKHGVVGFTKSIALEGAEHGVTCNSICPGYVLTPLVEKQIPDTAKARGMTEEQVKRDVLLAAQPTKEFATVQQIGALAVFLCSDAAKQITGAALPVDGGWTAQ